VVSVLGDSPRRWLCTLLILTITLSAVEFSEISAVHNISAQERRIYILCTGDAGERLVFRLEMLYAVVGFLEGVGLKYHIIKSVDDWGSLIKSEAEGVVVINCHGEVIPIPSYYGDDYSSFYRDLANLIKDEGWIFIQIVGYGFYYVGNRKTVGSVYEVGDTGASVFFNSLGLSYHEGSAPDIINPWCDSQAILTSTGEDVSKVVGIDIPESVEAIRALAIATDRLPDHIKILWYLYKVPEETKVWQDYPYLGVVAIKVGKGILVWGGIKATGTDCGKIAVVATTYVLNPQFTTIKPRFSLIMQRAIRVYSLVAVITLFVALILVILYKKSVPPEVSAKS